MAVEALRSRIGSAMSNRDFAEVEAAWREYATLHPEDWEYLLQIAGQLSRYDKGPVVGELCVSLAHQPASTLRVHLKHKRHEIVDFVRSVEAIPPEER